MSALDLDAEQFFGFMRSLDESVGTLRANRGGRGDEPLLDEAFENLHLAIEKLQQAVELSLRRAAPRSPTPEAEPIPGEVPDSPLRRIQGFEGRARRRGRA